LCGREEAGCRVAESTHEKQGLGVARRIHERPLVKAMSSCIVSADMVEVTEGAERAHCATIAQPERLNRPPAAHPLHCETLNIWPICRHLLFKRTYRRVRRQQDKLLDAE
jgi:hypothetical protein